MQINAWRGRTCIFTKRCGVMRFTASSIYRDPRLPNAEEIKNTTQPWRSEGSAAGNSRLGAAEGADKQSSVPFCRRRPTR
jgi:hypothetical protein